MGIYILRGEITINNARIIQFPRQPSTVRFDNFSPTIRRILVINNKHTILAVLGIILYCVGYKTLFTYAIRSDIRDPRGL